MRRVSDVFQAGDVVKCVKSGGYYEEGKEYVVGIDRYGDFGVIDSAGDAMFPRFSSSVSFEIKSVVRNGVPQEIPEEVEEVEEVEEYKIGDLFRCTNSELIFHTKGTVYVYGKCHVFRGNVGVLDREGHVLNSAKGSAIKENFVKVGNIFGE